MKKMLLTLLFVVSLVSVASAGSQYDVITKNENYQTILKGYDKNIAPEHNWVNYLNLLANYNDLIALAKTGELDKEKSKYLMENSNTFIKYYHTRLVMEIGKNKPPVDEAQIVYVSGVITSPKAQAATNSTEYEIEKQILRGFIAYKVWELLKSPGFLAKSVNEELDNLYRIVTK
jgi:hypothetical protein